GSDDIPYSAERYDRALELGAGWNRFPLYWDRVETEPGAFTWGRYDEAVQRDIDHGLQTDLILLGGIPSFWRQDEFGRITGLNETIFSDGTSTPGTPDNPKAPNPDNGWAVFVHETVNRYMPGGELAQQNGWAAGEGVTVWEIWNEPDFPAFWTAGIANYARLLKVAYIVTHQLDEDATVMFGGLAYTTDVNWLAQVMAIYINDPQHEQFNFYMDAVAVHNYGSSWRSGWLVLFAKRTFAEYGVDKPVWLNESGLPAWDDYPGPTWAADQPDLRQLRGTQAQQAAFFVQSTAWAYAEGAEVVFYHQLYDDCGDQPAGSNLPPHDGELCADGLCFGDAFGIYRNDPGSVCFSQHPEPDTARPVADSYKLIAEVFGEIPFSARGAAVENFDAGVTTIAFVRAALNERIVVVWNTELEDTTFDLAALGTEAQVISLDSERTITATDGVYTLDLPGGEPDNNPYAREWEQTTVGGMPVILIESVNEATAEQFLLDTGAIAPATAPEPTSLPGSNIDDEEIAGLIADSPTGVVFISLNISRIRSRPDTTSASRVLGNINPGQAASVIGRTPDDAWLLLDFNGAEVWVASFLGERYGDDARVATLRTIPYPPEPYPTVLPPPAAESATEEAQP
ncbi:MAG: SH3 domain-containing protein, partial [Chloroflexota bacterium]